MTDKPTRQPTEAPVEQPTEQPAEAPTEAPAEASAARPADLPAPRGARQSGPRDMAGIAFVMGVMVALGVGLAEDSAVVGLVTLAAFVPLAAVVYLISTRAIRER